MDSILNWESWRTITFHFYCRSRALRAGVGSVASPLKISDEAESCHKTVSQINHLPTPTSTPSIDSKSRCKGGWGHMPKNWRSSTMVASRAATRSSKARTCWEVTDKASVISRAVTKWMTTRQLSRMTWGVWSGHKSRWWFAAVAYWSRWCIRLDSVTYKWYCIVGSRSSSHAVQKSAIWETLGTPARPTAQDVKKMSWLTSQSKVPKPRWRRTLFKS